MKEVATSFFSVAPLVKLESSGSTSVKMAKGSSQIQEGSYEQLVDNQRRMIEGGRRTYPLTRVEFGALIGIFVAFLLALLVIYLTMPAVDYTLLKIPYSPDDLRSLTEYIATYAKDYKPQVVLGFCVTYIFMQTFMIPGTIVMSLLSGSLFGAVPGMLLVIFTATTGASCCFFLSKLIGRPLAMWMWPDKLRYFNAEVGKRRKYLFNYMLFLRITPTLPNTFINVASPIVDIPFHIFFLATVIGLIPACFITVRTGRALGDLKSLGQLYDVKTLATLFFIGLVSIVPTLVGKKLSPSSNPRPS